MLTLRRISANDEAALAQLFRRNNDLGVLRFFHPFPLDESEARRIARYSGRDRYYLLVDVQEVAGFSMLRGWDEGYSVPSLGMFVDLLRQGQGLGKSLLRETVKEAQRMGARQVRLSVHADNARALALYESAGFRVQERKVSTIDGDTNETLILVLDLVDAS